MTEEDDALARCGRPLHPVEQRYRDAHASRPGLPPGTIHATVNPHRFAAPFACCMRLVGADLEPWLIVHPDGTAQVRPYFGTDRQATDAELGAVLRAWAVENAKRSGFGR